MTEADAPRLRAFLRRYEGGSVIAMQRSDWSGLGVTSDQTVVIDLTQTPLKGVPSDASVVAAVARRYSAATGEVVIYRYDRKDEPTPINEDRYDVWLDLGSNTSYRNIVQAASTDDNENMRSYLDETVFLVKQEPGPEHWLPELPATVKVILRST